MHNQDLHIHTTYSTGDAAVVPEQTIALVARARHARIVGISDHFEFLVDGAFEHYAADVRKAGLKLGTEVNGHEWVAQAIQADCDYYIFHCYNRDADYQSLETLLATEKPIIVAHPNALDTDLNRVPPDCLIEINNRYIWRCDWHKFYGPFCDRFRFVLSSDAHQPNWLGQSIATCAARELGIHETLLFAANIDASPEPQR